MPCDLVLNTLAAGGPLGDKLADIISDLVGKAAECGELEIAQHLGGDGQLVRVKRFPSVWIDRLDKAVETGSLERFSADRIVMILLTGPR